MTSKTVIKNLVEAMDEEIESAYLEAIIRKRLERDLVEATLEEIELAYLVVCQKTLSEKRIKRLEEKSAR